MTEKDERTIGRLEAHVEDLRGDVRAMREDIADLKAMVEQAKGARVAVATLASAFGGVGGLMTAWLAGWLRAH